MNSARSLLIALVMLAATATFAQSHDHTSATSAPPTEAQQSFAELKTLAGDWEGPVTVNPPIPEMGDTKMQLTMRVTSRGHAIVHEFQEAGTPLDPTKYDHPVTMIYLNNDDLSLVHYCDAGNRPHMVARKSPDGKNVEFDFVDLSGGNQNGHMDHAVFTFIDANHHTEDWTYMMPGDKPMHAHFDLRRAKQ
jgi:hypothetical protein